MGKSGNRTAVLTAAVLLILVLFSACDGLVNTLGGADTTALTAAISAAETAKSGATVSDNGSDVDSSAYWVTRAEMDALETAITKAAAARDDSSISQVQVSNAKATLNAEVDKFFTARRSGLGGTKAGLSAAISAAETAMTGVAVSVDGSELSASSYWVSLEEMTALTMAIADATREWDNASAVTDLTEATSVLNAAVAAFTAAKRPGTNAGGGPEANKTALTTAIGAAETAKAGIPVSIDGSDVSASNYWVTGAEMKALETAIAVAEMARDNPSATQTEVDNATSTLTNAVGRFGIARKAGIQSTPVAGLVAAISVATTAKAGVKVSVNGSEVSDSAYWVTRAEMNALEAAIINAETVRNDLLATPTELANEITVLNNAVAAFNTAKKFGTKAEEGVIADKVNLIMAISAATTAKTGATVSVDGSELSASDYWVTRAEMDALEGAIASAETVRDNPSATQTQVNNATTALKNAVASFTVARKPGKPLEPGVTITGLPSRFNGATIYVVLLEGIDNLETGNYEETMVSMGMGSVQNGSATVALLDLNLGPWSETGSWYVGFIIGEGDVFEAAYVTQSKQSFRSGAARIPFSSFVEMEIDELEPLQPIPGGSDTTGLATAIDTAITQAEVRISVDGSGLSASDYWVTWAEMDALVTAINAALMVLYDPSATQTEVDDATTALNNAVAAFNAAKRPGQGESMQEENPGKVGVTITGLPSRFNDVPIGVALFERIANLEAGYETPISWGFGSVRGGSATVDLGISWVPPGSWYVAFFVIGEGDVDAVYITKNRQSFSSLSTSIPFSSFEEVKITGGLGNLIPGDSVGGDTDVNDPQAVTPEEVTPGGSREGESGEGGPQPVTPAAAGLNVSAWKKLSTLRVTP
jgi:hypothetical protein